MIGQGVATYDEPLFRNLRAHGTYFGNVKPDNGLELLLAEVERAGEAASSSLWPLVCRWRAVGQAKSVTYRTSAIRALEPRGPPVEDMQTEIARPGMGPEELRTDWHG